MRCWLSVGFVCAVLVCVLACKQKESKVFKRQMTPQQGVDVPGSIPASHVTSRRRAPALRGVRLRSSLRRHPCLQGWRRGVQKERLLLSSRLRVKLLKQALSPHPIRPKGAHRRIIKRYDRLLLHNKRLRRCLYRRWRKSRGKRRKRALRQSEEIARWVLERAVLPLWLGTRWDFYGTATKPHQKRIACGYFLVHALLSVGFLFPETFWYRSRKRGPMKIYEFAKQSAFGMARLMSSRALTVVQSRRPVSALISAARRLGPGLFVLGLDNHVGLVLYDGKNAYFWHAAFEEPKVWVKRERLEQAGVVRASQLKMLAKLSPKRIRGWLQRASVRVKPKRR